MDREHYKTEDMDTGNKKDLFEKKHPIVRLLSEIEEILVPGEEKLLTKDYISLKKLFGRERMDEWHIDQKQLILLAQKMLVVCEKLAERNITPGFYDLEDIYTDKEHLYLCYPQRFQLLSYEQDYEWYPEEEKLFGDITLLGEYEQELADCRLLYKILVASTKGNVKIPPKMTEADYADIFYQKLTPDLKTFFAEPKKQTREYLKELLERALDEARDVEVQEVPQPNVETVKSEKPSQDVPVEETPLACMFLILRTNLNQSSKIGKLLYDLQDAVEMECEMAHYDLLQSFAYGDGKVSLRKMRRDPNGFRIQLKNQIKNYSEGEVIVIAADYMEAVLNYCKQNPKVDCRCVILYDGELQNSAMFQFGLQKLLQLKERGMRFLLASDKIYSGEACQKLEQLLNRQEDQYVAQAFDGI